MSLRKLANTQTTSLLSHLFEAQFETSSADSGWLQMFANL